MKFGNYMEGTCHPRLGGAFAREGGGSRSILSNF